MAHFGFDIDGTIDADPTSFCSLMAALKACGHRVTILTGSAAPTATQQDWDEKAQYLQSLGAGSCWDDMVVFSDPTAEPKAQWCKDNGVDALFDNNVDNAKAAMDYCTVLVPWASKEKPGG